MIKLKVKDINQQAFLIALRKLMSCATFPGSTAYLVAKIGKATDEEMKIANETYKKIAEPFLLKDAEGKSVCAKDKDGKELPGTFELDPAKTEEWAKVLNEFMETEITLPYSKIPLHHLDGVGLTPAEVHLVESLLEPLEESAPVVAKLQKV